MKMKKTTIIFDFDGTLVDTLDLVVKIANRLAPKFGFQKVKHEDIAGLREESPFQIMQKFHVPPLKVHSIVIQGRREFTKELSKIKTIEGIKKILVELKKRGLQLGILTTNSEANIQKFIKLRGLKGLFDFVYGDIGIFGKTHALKKILKEKKLSPNEVIYIGDEIRDIDAAKKVGITSVAVSWGFNTHDFLARHNPNFLIDKPEGLLSILNEHFE